MSKIKMNKEEMEKVLQEILDKNISTGDFQEITEKSLENDEFDKVNAILLEHYEKSDKTGDFEQRVKLILKAKVGNEAISKIEENEKNTDIDEQAKTIEGADEQTIKETKEKIKEQKERGEDEIDVRSILLKQVYIDVFKEYSNVLYQMKMNQIGKDEITIGKKEGTELVLYENYLKKLERNYSGYASIHKDVKEKTLSDFSEVKEQKEELCKKLGRETDLSRERIEKKMKEIEELYKERRATAKKIEELSLEGKYDSQQIDEYQKEYMVLTYKIRDIEPSLEDYAIQMETEKGNYEFAKEYGLDIDDRDIVAGKFEYSEKLGKLDKDKDGIEDRLDKDFSKASDDEVTVAAKHIYDLINGIEVQINQGRFEEARELMDQARTELGIKENAQDEAREEKTRDTNEKLDDNIDRENERANDNINGKIITNFDEKESWKLNTLEDDSIEKKDEYFEELKEIKDKFKEVYPEDWNNELKKQELVSKEKQI